MQEDESSYKVVREVERLRNRSPNFLQSCDFRVERDCSDVMFLQSIEEESLKVVVNTSLEEVTHDTTDQLQTCDDANENGVL